MNHTQQRDRIISAAFAVRTPVPARAPTKVCCSCGKDVARGWRYKDAGWSYWCQPCRAIEDRSIRRYALRRAAFHALVTLLLVALLAALWFWS